MTDLDAPPSPDLSRLVAIPARMILLADGQHWGLALPTPRYGPEVVSGVDPLGRPTATTRAVARIGYPLGIERLVAELRLACRAGADSTNEARRFDTLISLAVALLRRAHDLPLSAAVALLDLDSEGFSRLVDAVLAIVAGVPSQALAEPDLSSAGGDHA